MEEGGKHDWKRNRLNEECTAARLGHAEEDDWDGNQPAWREDRNRKEMGLGRLWLEGSTFAEANEQEMLCKTCNKRPVSAPVSLSLCQQKKGGLL